MYAISLVLVIWASGVLVYGDITSNQSVRLYEFMVAIMGLQTVLEFGTAPSSFTICIAGCWGIDREYVWCFLGCIVGAANRAVIGDGAKVAIRAHYARYKPRDSAP